MNSGSEVHETQDVNWSPVLRWSAGLLLLLIAVSASMAGWFFLLRGRHAAAPSSAAPAIGDEVVQQLQSLRQAEDQRLNSYRWISQPHGIVRIPIDRAMQGLVEEHATKMKGQIVENMP